MAFPGRPWLIVLVEGVVVLLAGSSLLGFLFVGLVVVVVRRAC